MEESEWEGPFFEGIKKLSKTKKDYIIEEKDEKIRVVPEYFQWGDEKVVSLLQTSPEFLKIVKELNSISCIEMEFDIHNGETDYVGPNGLLYVLTNETPSGSIYNAIELKCRLKKPKCIYVQFEPTATENNFKGSSVHPWTIEYIGGNSERITNDWNSSFPIHVGTRQSFSGCLLRIKGLPQDSSFPKIDPYQLAISIIHESIHFHHWYTSRKEIISRTTFNRKCKVPVEKLKSDKYQELLELYILDEMKTRNLEMSCASEIWDAIPSTTKEGLDEIELKLLQDILLKENDYIDLISVQMSRITSQFPVTYVENFTITAIKNELSAYTPSVHIEGIREILYDFLSKEAFTPDKILPKAVLDIVEPWDNMHVHLEDYYLDIVHDKFQKKFSVYLPRHGELFLKLCGIAFTEIVISQRWITFKNTVYVSDELEKREQEKMAEEHLKGYFGSKSFYYREKKLKIQYFTRFQYVSQD